MGFVVLKCPTCGADIQLDNTREFGFCSYCGTKILQDKQIIENRIIQDRTREIQGNLQLASRALSIHSYDKAQFYFEKVLTVDPNNQEALTGINYIDSVIEKPNVCFIRDYHYYKSNKLINVFIDDNFVCKLASCKKIDVIVPVGEHTIHFTTHSDFLLGDKKKITIPNRYIQTVIRVKYCKDKDAISISQYYNNQSK